MKSIFYYNCWWVLNLTLDLTLTFSPVCIKIIAKADFSSCEKSNTQILSFPKCLLSAVQDRKIRMQSNTPLNTYWFQCSATGKISCTLPGGISFFVNRQRKASTPVTNIKCPEKSTEKSPFQTHSIKRYT